MLNQAVRVDPGVVLAKATARSVDVDAMRSGSSARTNLRASQNIRDERGNAGCSETGDHEMRRAKRHLHRIRNSWMMM